MHDDRCDVLVYFADALRCDDVARRRSTASAEICASDAPIRETARCRLRATLDARSWQRRLQSALVLCALLLVCCELAYAGSTTGPAASETFINSAQANNNNGGAPLIYLGNDPIYGGSMRGLVRFNVPSSLNDRMVITSTDFSLFTCSLTGGAPAAATVSLQRLIQGWGQGNGAGTDPITGDYTYGSACTAGGATWNQPFCSGVGWTTAGGTVNGTLSASASAPATSGVVVKWSSGIGAGMASDVQGWVSNPSSNYGWRLFSSTEATSGNVQCFAKSTVLNISYACKAGFQETAGTCTTCTTSAQSACVTAQAGNTCNDSGPPSSAYSCTCNNAAYVLGPGGTSCVDKNECLGNPCAAVGDAAAVCTDHVAPSTGYSCTCSAGYVFGGTACVDQNECIPNHCVDGGDTAAICVDHVAPSTGYSCTCSDGFVEINGICDDTIFADTFE